MQPRHLYIPFLTLAILASVITSVQASLIDAGCSVDLEAVTRSQGETQNEYPIIDGVVGDVSTTEGDSFEVSTGEILTCRNELSIGKLSSVTSVNEYSCLFANPPPLKRLKPPQASSPV